jgi:hypothetical protein
VPLLRRENLADIFYRNHFITFFYPIKYVS